MSELRWTVGLDGEPGKVVFPESFDGVVATEVSTVIITLGIDELTLTLQSVCHDRNTSTLWRISC